MFQLCVCVQAAEKARGRCVTYYIPREHEVASDGRDPRDDEPGESLGIVVEFSDVFGEHQHHRNVAHPLRTEQGGGDDGDGGGGDDGG